MSTLAFIRRKLPGPEAAALVNRVRDIIVAGIRPDAVFVFGSAARGELSDQSDIDLLIVMPTESAIDAARKKIAKIRHQFGVPVDLVWITPQEYKRRVQNEEGTFVVTAGETEAAIKLVEATLTFAESQINPNG